MTRAGEVALEDGGPAGSVLRMSGEVDLHVVEQVPAHVMAALGEVRVADVSGLTFMDSLGMHLLVVAAVGARGRGERLWLRGAGTYTEELLSLVGLRDLFATDRRSQHTPPAAGTTGTTGTGPSDVEHAGG